MEIQFLDSVDSTHTYLKNHVKTHGFTNPLCIATTLQTAGIGSRDNSWEGKRGNLFFSFVIKKEDLPDDLLMQSYSIYFSYLLKEILNSYGSKLWLKWPNDFYIDDKKIGGTITNLSGELVYCGIGLNLIQVEEQFGFLDITIEPKSFLQEYLEVVTKKNSWKKLFSKYLLEFELSRKFKATIKDQKVSLEKAVLNEDGSISIDKQKVYSLR